MASLSVYLKTANSKKVQHLIAETTAKKFTKLTDTLTEKEIPHRVRKSTLVVAPRLFAQVKRIAKKSLA